MSNHRPSPIFIADSRGLDFLNSFAHPLDEGVEWLDTGEDLLAWLEQAEMIPEDVSAQMRAASVPGELDAVAGQARLLREWFRGFVVKHKSRPLAPAALQELEPLNRVLARDEAFSQIAIRQAGDHDDPAPSGLAFEARRRWRAPDTLLLPVATAMANLICEDDFSQVKACEGHNCTLLFVDRTKKKGRKWCSMAVCGNRAKLSAFRSRQKQAT